jgi:hypothetical protein
MPSAPRHVRSLTTATAKRELEGLQKLSLDKGACCHACVCAGADSYLAVHRVLKTPYVGEGPREQLTPEGAAKLEASARPPRCPALMPPSQAKRAAAGKAKSSPKVVPASAASVGCELSQRPARQDVVLPSAAGQSDEAPALPTLTVPTSSTAPRQPPSGGKSLIEALGGDHEDDIEPEPAAAATAAAAPAPTSLSAAPAAVSVAATRPHYVFDVRGSGAGREISLEVDLPLVVSG